MGWELTYILSDANAECSEHGWPTRVHTSEVAVDRLPLRGGSLLGTCREQRVKSSVNVCC